MKKVLIFICTLAVVTGVNAQKSKTAELKKYRFGFKIAPNVGWIKSDKPQKITPDGGKLGFSYGFTFDRNFTKNLGFSTGIDVTGINGNIINKFVLTYKKYDPTLNRDTSVTSNGIPGVNYGLKLKYLEIPLLFTGKTNEIGYMTYFMQGGLTPGILIRQKAHITNANPASWETDPLINSKATDEFTTEQDDIIRLRLAFTVGAGVEYNLTGGTSLVASFRYNNSLFKVLKNVPDRVINNYISLNVGIVF
jgi:opacity protein-like surface antigen